MSEEDRDREGRDPEQDSGIEPPDPDAMHEDGDEPPRITLDRYLSKRRAPPRSGISQLIAAVVMLVTLVMIILYKDRCGQVVSGVMGELDTKQQDRPVRIEVKEPKTK